MKQAVSLILVALAAALSLTTSPAHAQVELTEVDPPDGARLDAPPDLVHICFSEPVIIEDSAAYQFRFFRPDGSGLGHRDRFQPDGECLDIFVNVPDDYSAGQYTLEWRVTAAEGGGEGSGTLRYQVTQAGSPAPTPTTVGAPSPPTSVELTEVDPPDGARLDAPPEVVHICFSEPVAIDDSDTFDFAYTMPDGRVLGRRTAFQTDGLCVDVFPGLPEERPAGEYSIEWRVTAVEGEEESFGTIRFQVTQSTSVEPSPAASPTLKETPGTGQSDGDDGPDILLAALITTGVVGGAVVLFTLAYLLRRLIGYDIHRPPEGGEGGEHH